MTRTQYDPAARHAAAARVRAALGPASRLLTGVAACLVAAGCASPLDRTYEEALRERAMQARRDALTRQPGADAIRTVTREASEVEQQLSDERREELDAMAGQAAYADQPLPLGDDLLGIAFGPSEVVKLTLEEAIALAVVNNLDVASARLSPQIAFEDVVQAEAAFDAEFFADLDYSNLDTPQPPGVIGGLSGDVQSQDVQLNAGIRKAFDYGTLVTLQTTPRFQAQEPSINAFDNFYTASIAASVQQPLLEGFGRKVNRAQIRLDRNATLNQRQVLRGTLLNVVNGVHQAYWDLFTAERGLLIQQRLLERTVEDRDRLVQRRDFDVSPVRITEANSFVELRRSDVIRARQNVRFASDNLKALLDAPDLPVAGETLVLPADAPTLEPITFNLVELVSRALLRRPELEQALLDISDAGIRRDFAENALLPQLDLAFTLALNGLNEDDLGDAYNDDIFELNFIDYIASLQFEQAIGNRADRSTLRQANLARDQTVLIYRQQARDVVLDVKNALRGVITSYELIGATRAARRAAADSLRAIEAQEDAGVALTPEFLLDLKLATQQRLADAETQEVEAIADYNTAIGELFLATGTLLERHNVEVEPPRDWPDWRWWRDGG